MMRSTTIRPDEVHDVLGDDEIEALVVSMERIQHAFDGLAADDLPEMTHA